jgi:hypothetical protein
MRRREGRDIMHPAPSLLSGAIAERMRPADKRQLLKAWPRTVAEGKRKRGTRG